MKNPINILLLFVLLAACTSVPAGKGISYSDFPKTVKLEGQVIPLDTAVFRYPFRIRIEGGRAVVLDLHGADHFFRCSLIPMETILPLMVSVAIRRLTCFLPKTFDGMGINCGCLMPIKAN